MLRRHSVLTHLLFSSILWDTHYLHFTDEDVEAQQLRNLPQVTVLDWDLNPGHLVLELVLITTTL